MSKSEGLSAKAGALERAMARDNPEGRQWLRGGHVDSYGGESNRVEFWALEGSPARGFIIFRISDGTAWRYDGYGKRIATFTAFDETLRAGA